jgi:hypothetical protein
MEKVELQHRLKESHTQFVDFIASLSETEFLYSRDSKWTAGQQLDHIIKSVSPVKTAFSLPTFMLRVLFGKANRHTRTYDALIEKYHQKLAAGGKATSRFIPPSIKNEQRQQLINQLNKTVGTLAGFINTFSERQLDTHILPHPLLGKLTLREMLYFTIYHVQHHEKNIREALKTAKQQS